MTWRAARREDYVAGWIWAGSAVALLALRDWAPRLAALAPGCLFHALLGLPCPTCGATRALLGLLDGRLGEAVRWNPLAVAAAVAFLAGAAAAPAWLHATGRVPLLPALWPRSWRLAVPALLLLNWSYLIARGL